MSQEAIKRVEQAIEDIKHGKMVIMMDDEDRENEGDLVYAATFSTPELVNFMAKEARGLICAPITKEIASKLDLMPMVSRAFGVLVEEEGVALRGRFLFNPDGICVAQEVQADSVGRNVNEFLRQVEAWQHATKTGEVCPAGWRPGKKTLPVNTDAEQMTGRVGDYITIEEILS